MNDDLDFPPQLTLRRQNAQIGDVEENHVFVDSQTQEVVFGNPDLEHVTNQNLVSLNVVPNTNQSNLIRWQSGYCNSKVSLFPKKDDHEPGANPGLNCVSGFTN